MAAPLDAATRANLRADLSDVDTPQVFTDTELDTLWQRAAGDYDRTLLLAFDHLVRAALSEVDYTIGQEREQASQWYDHLRAERQIVQERLTARQTSVQQAPRLSTSVPVRVGW